MPVHWMPFEVTKAANMLDKYAWNPTLRLSLKRAGRSFDKVVEVRTVADHYRTVEDEIQDIL